MNSTITIKSFPASNGESFLVSCKCQDGVTNILIDTGYVSTANMILEECKNLKVKNQKLDLMILTHIDNDHINGARKVLDHFSQNSVEELVQIWYNDYFKLFDASVERYENEKNVGEKEQEILENILNVPYPKEKNQYGEKKIGFESAQFIEQFLINKEISEKWNKDFGFKCVAIQNKPVRKKINKYVSIVLLNPTIDILERQYKEWKEYLIKKGFSTSLVKNYELAKAFELTLMKKDESIIAVKERECGSDFENHKALLEYEDYDEGLTNRTSISFVIECNDKKLMFLGDSSPLELEKSISEYLDMVGRDTVFELVKMPHHGSKNNWSLNLMKIIKSEKYLIATNGSGYNHPDIETILKILYSETLEKNIYFNYKPQNIIQKLNFIGELKKFDYKIIIENEKKNCKKIQEINI